MRPRIRGLERFGALRASGFSHHLRDSDDAYQSGGSPRRSFRSIKMRYEEDWTRMPVLNEKQAKLFTDRNWGVIATIREDGSPQATPVWIDYDGENVLVNSARGRTKVKNIERDPRATVTVLPAEDQQSGYVMVSGTASIVEEGALEHINMLSKKYLGEDRYPYLGPSEQGVIIQIHPERVDGFAPAARASQRPRGAGRAQSGNQYSLPEYVGPRV